MATSDTDPVASPCVRLCTLDEDDICIGCWRTLDEICAWGSAGNNRRREILERAAERAREKARA